LHSNWINIVKGAGIASGFPSLEERKSAALSLSLSFSPPYHCKTLAFAMGQSKAKTKAHTQAYFYAAGATANQCKMGALSAASKNKKKHEVSARISSFATRDSIQKSKSTQPKLVWPAAASDCDCDASTVGLKRKKNEIKLILQLYQTTCKISLLKGL